MGFDVSYHPISELEIQKWYTDRPEHRLNRILQWILEIKKRELILVRSIFCLQPRLPPFIFNVNNICILKHFTIWIAIANNHSRLNYFTQFFESVHK